MVLSWFVSENKFDVQKPQKNRHFPSGCQTCFDNSHCSSATDEEAFSRRSPEQPDRSKITFALQPSQQENASDLEESSEEEVRVGQVAKMVWKICLLVFFDIFRGGLVLKTSLNSWCTSKQNSSSDHLRKICLRLKTVVMGE